MLIILGPFSFHIYFGVYFSISTKVLLDLIGIMLNLEIKFGRTDILTILSILIHQNKTISPVKPPLILFITFLVLCMNEDLFF